MAAVPQRQNGSIVDPVLSLMVQQAELPFVPEQPPARESATGKPKMIEISFMREA